MKKFLIISVFITATICAGAQITGFDWRKKLKVTDTLIVDGKIGLGTISPDGSASFDIVSTTKGFLPPRMTAAQRLAISSPANALMVYDTDSSRYMIYMGSWKGLMYTGEGGGGGGAYTANLPIRITGTVISADTSHIIPTNLITSGRLKDKLDSMTAAGMANFANTNLTLTGSRTHDFATNSMTWINSGTFTIYNGSIGVGKYFEIDGTQRTMGIGDMNGDNNGSMFQVADQNSSASFYLQGVEKFRTNTSGILMPNGVMPTAGSGGTDSAWFRNSSTGQAYLAPIVAGGSTNTSVGAGYKVAINSTNNIKSLKEKYGIILDSATANEVGIKADTLVLTSTLSRKKLADSLGALISTGNLTVGTTAISSGTANRVLFQNGSNVLSEDADLQFDGTTFSTRDQKLFGDGDITYQYIGDATTTEYWRWKYSDVSKALSLSTSVDTSIFVMRFTGINEIHFWPGFTAALLSRISPSYFNTGTDLIIGSSADAGTYGFQVATNSYFSDRIAMLEIGAPATPAANTVAIYPKSDGLWYGKDDAGTETKLSNDAGGGANTALSNLAAVAINTSLLPATDDAIDLGSATKQWKDLYMTGASLYMDGVKTLQATGLTMPTGAGLRTRTTAANTLLLQAYDVDGAAYTTFGTLTANNTPTLDFSSAVTFGGATLAATYQPLDADLTTVAGLTATTDNFLVSVASAWASRTPAQVRTTLALVIGTDVQAYDADLTTYAGITPSANVQTMLGSADNSAIRSNIGLAIGTNVQAFDADLTTWAGLTPTTLGQNIVTLTNPSALGFIRTNADNTVTHRSYANTKVDLSLDNVTNESKATMFNNATFTGTFVAPNTTITNAMLAGSIDLTTKVTGILPSGNLPATVVYTGQANTYTAGMKQTFTSDATTAGIRWSGVSANPSSLVSGDLWYRTDELKFRYYDGTTARALVAEALAQTLTNKDLTSSTNTLGGITMTLGSDAANDIYYRNGSGILTRLANGTTGQLLSATTGAAPSWSTPSGSGQTFQQVLSTSFMKF